MSYDAITIDTNIALEFNLNFESGMLSQLFQFRSGAVAFVISEVVEREIKRRLVANTAKARDQVRKAAQRANQYQLLLEAQLQELSGIVEKLEDPEEVAAARLGTFLKQTDAEIIPAEQIKLATLLDYYFSATPPFEPSGAKKSEFPDAIALISLDDWANKLDMRILAVSKDAGWSRFAEASERIDVIPELKDALATLQGHHDKAKALLATLLGFVGARTGIEASFREHLDLAVSTLSALGEGDADLHAEAELVEFSLSDYSLIGKESVVEFTIVQIGETRIVAEVPLEITAEASTDFSLSTWDSVDREYVTLGTASARKDIDFTVAALVTFEGDLEGDPEDIVVSELELVDPPSHVDFGYIEFDSGEDIPD